MCLKTQNISKNFFYRVAQYLTSVLQNIFFTKTKLYRSRETEANAHVISIINVSTEISPHFQEKVENVCGVTVR